MQQPAVTVVIIGEGITEKYFFESLRDVLTIRPVISIQKHTNIADIEKRIKNSIKEGYDKIFCLVDMDNKINDGRPEHRKHYEAYYRLKKRYHNKCFQNRVGQSEIMMFESYPSTELFFLYYFGYKGAEYSNKELKEILHEKTGYKVEEKFFIKKSLHNLFVSSGGSLESAISASERSIQNRDLGNPHASYTEIGLLIKNLLNPDKP